MESPINELSQALVGRSYQFRMPVRWGDLDLLNHVNNSIYFRYMEEARVNCMNEAGIGVHGATREIVLAHTACDFLRSISWPAELLIDMRLQRIGRSSLEYQAEISVDDDPEGPYLRARNVIVGTDTATGRSSPWTLAELQGLERVFRET